MTREKHSASSGSALLVILGILSIASMLIFAYAFSSRAERLSARRSRDAVTARHLADSIVDLVMSRELPVRLRTMKTNNELSQFNGKIDFNIISKLFDDNNDYFSEHAFTSCMIDTHDCGQCEIFKHNVLSDYIPGAIHDELESLSSDWLPMESVSESSGNVVFTNALYAYAVINLSGFLDAHCISEKQAEWLEDNADSIDNAHRFLEDRALQTSPEQQTDIYGYVSYKDLILRNRGIKKTPEHLYHLSYDPAPDVTVLREDTFPTAIYSDFETCNRAAKFLPKFDINSWTNDFTGQTDDTIALQRYYESSEFRDGWLAEVTNRLAYCGFAAAEPIAWNLVNFLDGDKIPQSRSPFPWRDDWPQEDVPLINEIGVAQTPIETGYTNCYAVAVELWYPFVTNSITGSDNADLVMAVYTNWPGDSYFLGSYNPIIVSTNSIDNIVSTNQVNDTFCTNWVNSIICNVAPNHGFSVTNRITRMEYGTSTEFAVFTTPPERFVSFPVTIRNFATNFPESVNAPDVIRVAKRNDREYPYWTSNTNSTDQILSLYRHTENLPIGIQTYSTYVETNENEWVEQVVTVTNEIRLITRVRLGEHWVDEAMAYDPRALSEYHIQPFAFHKPCGMHVNDPRKNGHLKDWEVYEGIEFHTEDLTVSNIVFSVPSNTNYPSFLPETTNITYTANGLTNFMCTLCGKINAICDPWHTYGQGLPVFHANGPAVTAGDIGYIYEPYSCLAGSSVSRQNYWQSICLADNRVLAHRNHYEYTAGSVLDFFTVRGATSRSVQGLISANTVYRNVIGATLSDFTIGHAFQRTDIPDTIIEWMTDVYMKVYEKMYSANDQVPVGVSDVCKNIGDVADFLNAPNMFSESKLNVHWKHSLGNEAKEDILRELSERLSFRQQIFLVIVNVKITTPALTVSAEHRIAAIVVRDAFTGAWRIAEIHRL